MNEWSGQFCPAGRNLPGFGKLGKNDLNGVCLVVGLFFVMLVGLLVGRFWCVKSVG